MYTLLVVDDDYSFLAMIQKYFTKKNYQVYCAKSYEEMKVCLLKNHIDCILLDVKLQETNGYSICSELKKEYSIPIIFISNFGTEDDRVKGFIAGGDDYICKPVHMQELAYRIERRIHPSIQNNSKKVEDSVLHIDSFTRKVILCKTVIPLTDAEFDILWFLSQHEQKIYSHFDIFNMVWKELALKNDAHTVQVHVSALRKKLNAIYDKHEYIQTVWGKGYRFVWLQDET